MINNKFLLYNTGKYIQHLAITLGCKLYEYIYIYLNNFMQGSNTTL